MPWMSLSISLLLFVSLFLAFVRRCFAMTVDMLRLVVCCNHIYGVAVWWGFHMTRSIILSIWR